MEKNYYKILRVSENVTKEDIRRAYRKLAKKFHTDFWEDPTLLDRHIIQYPDLRGISKEIAEEKFKEISEAYEVLSDEEKRRNYDLATGIPILPPTKREGLEDIRKKEEEIKKEVEEIKSEIRKKEEQEPDYGAAGDGFQQTEKKYKPSPFRFLKYMLRQNHLRNSRFLLSVDTVF